MKTFDDESFILENYRLIPARKICYCGPFGACLRIKWLTKSWLLWRTWKDSSAKNDPPPDFHNERFRIMMEVMRVDDCVNTIDDQHVVNSFERSNRFMKDHWGNSYKTELNGSLYFVPDTRNSNEFNFQGYLQNFERVIMKHAVKIEKYRRNYPRCKTTVFFVSDESNNYVQVSHKEDLTREDEQNAVLESFIPHYSYRDEKFLEIIKNCRADFVIWMFHYKSLTVDGKRLSHPLVCIFDVKHIRKHIRKAGFSYDHSLMFKVKG